MMEIDDDNEIEEKRQEENMVENDTNMKNNKPQFLSQALTRQIVNKDDDDNNNRAMDENMKFKNINQELKRRQRKKRQANKDRLISKLEQKLAQLKQRTIEDEIYDEEDDDDIEDDDEDHNNHLKKEDIVKIDNSPYCWNCRLIYSSCIYIDFVLFITNNTI